MQRREFITLVGGAAAVSPLAARAQRSDKTWRIGFLGAASAIKFAALTNAFRDGLREFGYIEGRNIAIEFRWAEGEIQRLPALVAELVDLKVDVLVTHGTPGTVAAKRATKRIPIVMAVSGDAVATGLVVSLAHPGGNVTGTTFFGPELAAKRLELLRQAVPTASQIATLVNPDNPVDGPVLKAMGNTATSLGMKLYPFVARTPGDLDGAFAKIAGTNANGIVIFEDAMTVSNTAAIAELAGKLRLPLTGFAELAKAGGLIGYGADLPALFRHAGYFVDKILRGAKPSGIPVEQPTKFELIINLTTANALGLTIPQTLLATADKVIE